MTFKDALNLYGRGVAFEPAPGRHRHTVHRHQCRRRRRVDRECPPGYKQATNNEMELMACIVALRGIPPQLLTRNVQRIFVFTDSQYVRDYIFHAQAYWPKSG
jgi:ribonuclease HI